jgi:hypothetical protein
MPNDNTMLKNIIIIHFVSETLTCNANKHKGSLSRYNEIRIIKIYEVGFVIKSYTATVLFRSCE